MLRSDVYKLIDGERDYQDGLHLEGEHGRAIHSPEEWVMYMEDYLIEAKHILARYPDDIAHPKAMEIIRKVAAMGVFAMEQHSTAPRKEQSGIASLGRHKVA